MKKKSRILIYSLVMMSVFLMLTSSCKKNPTGPPVLTTTAVSNIMSTSAACGGNITSDGGTAITARGVCWSTGQNPTIADSKTTDGAVVGRFYSSITGLMSNTTYYVRAYATNSAGTGYGSAMSFTTLQVTDIDGNVYHTVKIGTQVWLVENLKTTHYSDGTAIPNVTDATTWSNLTTGAYCDYNNTPSNSDTYGRLYNWFAVNDGRNICPTGWHVPSDAEWTTLMTFLGDTAVAGGKLKEIGTTHWSSPNTGATNVTGFSALPGGYRYLGGPFFDIENDGSWWSFTVLSPYKDWSWSMGCDYGNVLRSLDYHANGYSVRCLSY